MSAVLAGQVQSPAVRLKPLVPVELQAIQALPLMVDAAAGRQEVHVKPTQVPASMA